MTNRPFAYTVIHNGYYDYTPVYPTLDKAVVALAKRGYPAHAVVNCQDRIRAYWEDDTTGFPSLTSYVEEVQVDLSAVVAYIDDLYAKSEVAYAKYRADFPNGTGFSGGPDFICRLDKKDLVAREVNKRKWRWKVAS